MPRCNCPNCGTAAQVESERIGTSSECPACHEVVRWSRPRKPDAPPALLAPYYAIAGITITLCFVPLVGLLVLPAAVGTLAFGFYIRHHFRTYGAFAVCQFAVVLAALAGFTFAERAGIEANRVREAERGR